MTVKANKLFLLFKSKSGVEYCRKS